ncbi:fimbria/pilus chaperone family protein [Serratia fonticola]
MQNVTKPSIGALMFYSNQIVKKLKGHAGKVIFAAVTLLVAPAVQASFQLETMTVILDASDGRKVFSVKNMSKEPILLSTKVEDIPGDLPIAKDILVSPPIIRIEPEESQQINFVLKKGVSIPHEIILKASFQGVGAAKQNVTKMPIRQEVAMLVMPDGMVESQKPWEKMMVKQSANQLTLTNEGLQVIRMSPNFTTLPDGKVHGIGQFYLRPGESKSVEVQGSIKEIKLSPLSRYGFRMANDATVAVK